MLLSRLRNSGSKMARKLSFNSRVRSKRGLLFSHLHHHQAHNDPHLHLQQEAKPQPQLRAPTAIPYPITFATAALRVGSCAPSTGAPSLSACTMGSDGYTHISAGVWEDGAHGVDGEQGLDAPLELSPADRLVHNPFPMGDASASVVVGATRMPRATQGSSFSHSPVQAPAAAGAGPPRITSPITQPPSAGGHTTAGLLMLGGAGSLVGTGPAAAAVTAHTASTAPEPALPPSASAAASPATAGAGAGVGAGSQPAPLSQSQVEVYESGTGMPAVRSSNASAAGRSSRKTAGRSSAVSSSASTSTVRASPRFVALFSSCLWPRHGHHHLLVVEDGDEGEGREEEEGGKGRSQGGQAGAAVSRKGPAEKEAGCGDGEGDQVGEMVVVHKGKAGCGSMGREHRATPHTSRLTTGYSPSSPLK